MPNIIFNIPFYNVFIVCSKIYFILYFDDVTSRVIVEREGCLGHLEKLERR